jgi:hypothetical protein
MKKIDLFTFKKKTPLSFPFKERSSFFPKLKNTTLPIKNQKANLPL